MKAIDYIRIRLTRSKDIFMKLKALKKMPHVAKNETFYALIGKDYEEDMGNFTEK